MLTQTEILTAVIALLKTKFKCTIYTDEVVEGFSQPCFFVKLVKTRNTENRNTNSNKLSIILTYFADKASNKQLQFLSVGDTLTALFGLGFKTASRFLKIDTIQSLQIGEEQDILQTTITIDYIDTNDYDYNSGYDTMGTLTLTEKFN